MLNQHGSMNNFELLQRKILKAKPQAHETLPIKLHPIFSNKRLL